MSWDNIEIKESSEKTVHKFVFTKNDAVAESVLYKYPTYKERTVICCSTQAGCPVGCRFCGAGDYFIRNLSAEEIIEQPKKLLEHTKEKVSEIQRLQIMFMSMGEPLLNWKNTAIALENLYEMYPNAALLLSTSAPKIDYNHVYELSQRIPTIGLQFSVHESTEENRRKLVPSNSTLDLWEIAEKGEAWAFATGRKPFFNYCVHEANNSDKDVKRLRNLFNPNIWECTISVICEREENVAAANERQKKLASDFLTKMTRAGFSTRMFDPAGQDDIGGGCGQLWFVQSWMQNNKDKIKKSAGFKYPKRHTPRT